MKLRHPRLQLIRSAAHHGFPKALAASLLLFGSSCSSSRPMARLFDRSPQRTASAATEREQAPQVTHAYVDAPGDKIAAVTPLGLEQATKQTPDAATTPSPSTSQSTPLSDISDPFAIAAAPAQAATSTPAQAVVAKASETTVVEGNPFADVQQTAASESSTGTKPDEPKVYNTIYVEEPAAAPAPRSMPTGMTLESEPAPAASTVTPVEHAPAMPLAAEPRVALDCPPVDCPPITLPQAACPPLNCPVAPVVTIPGMYQVPATMADEYLCDGGDKHLPVHYNGTDRKGLDTEDTVVEYKDHEGTAYVKASTQACIYAPRFAAVRTVSEPLTGVAIDRATGAHEGTPLASLHGKLGIDQQTQRDSLYAIHMRARASGLENRTTEDTFTKNDRHQLHTKLVNAFMDFGFIRDGKFDKVDIAILEQAIEAAFVWDGDLSVAVFAHDQAGQQVTGRRMAEDITGSEDPRGPGDLQIVKVADKSAAQPGEIVTFMIRFDNVGGKDLFDVRVVDNLTPRLQFIEGSIKSSSPGEMVLEDNGAGGKVLTFQFAEPLKAKTGAFVTFQCRVL